MYLKLEKRTLLPHAGVSSTATVDINVRVVGTKLLGQGLVASSVVAPPAGNVDCNLGVETASQEEEDQETRKSCAGVEGSGEDKNVL